MYSNTLFCYLKVGGFFLKRTTTAKFIRKNNLNFQKISIYLEKDEFSIPKRNLQRYLRTPSL